VIKNFSQSINYHICCPTLIELVESVGKGVSIGMKRGWFYLVGFVLFMLFTSHQVDAASNTRNIAIAINDQLIPFPDALPFIENNTTYVPVRFFSETAGLTLVMEQPGLISLQGEGRSLKLNLNQNQISYSDNHMDRIPLFIKNGRTYAPLRNIAEFFGYQVKYLVNGPIVRLVNTTDVKEEGTFLAENEQEIVRFYKRVNLSQRPKVYLTFDDGPNSGIGQILDILKEKEAKATFFMIETRMRTYPAPIKRLIKEGHYPALHSVTHNKSILYGGKPTAVAAEMVKSQKTLHQITGFHTALTRVPYGSKPYMTKSFRDELVKQHFKMWDWNVDSQDWKYQDNPTQIIKNVKEGFLQKINTKEPIVILFHINSGTVSALAPIIDFIYSKGFQCVPYQPNEHLVINFWKDNRL
jgi:peptidoglycan-N-acetylglucosamine deacetylase